MLRTNAQMKCQGPKRIEMMTLVLVLGIQHRSIECNASDQRRRRRGQRNVLVPLPLVKKVGTVSLTKTLVSNASTSTSFNNQSSYREIEYDVIVCID